MQTLALSCPFCSNLPSVSPPQSPIIRFSWRFSLIRVASSKKMIQSLNWNKEDPKDERFTTLIPFLCENKEPEAVFQILTELKAQGFLPDSATLSTLMLYFAQNGFFQQAQVLWNVIINSSVVPSVEVVLSLIDAYARMGQLEEIWRIVRESVAREFSFSHELYPIAVSCFGRAGQLEMMEEAMKEMVRRGFRVDSVSGNAFVKYYSIYGSLKDMEDAYERLKKSRILIEKGTIRAVASSYIRERKFYRFGEFLRDVGLQRRNVGNLLWNLLLLSYAANFKMKSLQREFLSMIDAGFSPDLTTFNIRALAFSRMSMLWDLHLSIDHMKHKGVAADLVTIGSLVDAYLERRLGRNLSFVLKKMNADGIPVVCTDPLVFEVFGKGDFHSSSEILLDSMRQKQWTYLKLVALYMRKKYRKNQIFWNY